MIGISKLYEWKDDDHNYIDNNYCYIEKLSEINFKIKNLISSNSKVKSLFLKDNNKNNLGNLFGIVKKEDLKKVKIKEKIDNLCKEKIVIILNKINY